MLRTLTQAQKLAHAWTGFAISLEEKIPPAIAAKTFYGKGGRNAQLAAVGTEWRKAIK